MQAWPAELATPEFDPMVQARVAPPVGWKLDPYKTSSSHKHAVWLSPSGRTAYGVIYFSLPLPVGLRIAKQMCLGLEAAHQEGVVHRDIKPQNMLILPETGELKIMDFGIARVSEVKAGAAGLTSTGTVMGTPDYMPPEQAQGHPADFRSGIYSLGVVFYEIFTGRLPFAGDSVMAVVLSHIQQPPPPPRQANPAVPGELEAIILRCLEKDPARRYQRVESVLEDLGAVSTRLDATAA